MIKPPLPENEDHRLAALREYDILDTAPEDAFDDLTRVAARICGTPIALVSLVDEHRQWFKSRVGLDASETPRDIAFCAHAILEPDEVMIVGDARQDPRFDENPLVVGDLNIAFYAGAPLLTPEGFALGTLCVIDHVPRELSDEDQETLQSLARAAVSQLELRKTAISLRDLASELTVTNKELTRRNDEIKRFYQVLSHELKTPITVAREFVSMVREGLAGEVNEEQKGFLAISLESCDRLAHDVDDLLDLTRIETGKLRLDIGPASASSLLETAATALRALATEAGLQLECSTSSELPLIAADKGRVVQVISNLVRNAIKFTPQGGKVTLEARHGPKADAFVELSVRDTGRGISPTDLEHVFERLYQCDDGVAASHEGLGLGLHLCREIVELHGGSISVESTEGAGTTFRFLLPRHEMDEANLSSTELQKAAT